MTLRAGDLSYTYLAGTPLAQPALAGVSFELGAGECLAVVGVSGSGKSTLARIVAGLTVPDRGSVTLDGEEIAARPPTSGVGRQLRRLARGAARLPARLVVAAWRAARRENRRALPLPPKPERRPVLLAFQNPEDQFFAGTVLAEVLAGLAPPPDPVLDDRMRRKPDDPDVIVRKQRITAAATAAREALRTVELEPHIYGTRNPFSLSGGEQRRLALALLLSRRPRVLVLDEPSAGLDGPGRERLYACIERIRREQGTAVLLVSHDLEEVAAVAERVVVLSGGRVALRGATADVLQDADGLIAAGLVPPPLVRVRAALERHGIALPGDWLSVDGALAALSTGAPALEQGHA